MSSRRPMLRFDQMHACCRVVVKGDEACKHLAAKLVRHGIEPGDREVAPQGRPYFLYEIEVESRSQYARAMNAILSTEGAELAD